MGKLLNALPLAFDNEMYYSRADRLKPIGEQATVRIGYHQ